MCVFRFCLFVCFFGHAVFFLFLLSIMNFCIYLLQNMLTLYLGIYALSVRTIVTTRILHHFFMITHLRIIIYFI